jgi:uncharacterized protein YdhG (YjbR/CyaY superfamily)
MTTVAKSVDEYVEEAPEERKQACVKLRALCQENLPGYEECIEHNMVCYKRDNVVEIAFANQKNYISFYPLKSEVKHQNEQLLTGLSHGKGCIRFANLGKMDFMVIKDILINTARSMGKSLLTVR